MKEEHRIKIAAAEWAYDKVDVSAYQGYIAGATAERELIAEQLKQERNKAIELIGAAQALCDWCESVGDKPDEYYLVKEALKTLTAHEL